MIFRKKIRYVLVESSEAINTSDPYIADSLKKQLMEFMGQLIYFKTNPQIASQLNDRVFVISMNRGYERNAVLALSFIKNVGEKKLGLYTIRTSGTIRSLKGAFRKLY